MQNDTSDKFILAVDQGTTSTKAFLVGENGRPIASASCAIKQTFPEPGWVSQDAQEIFRSVLKTMAQVLMKVPSSMKKGAVDSVAITNQRETTVCFSRKTGIPIAEAINWQCRRTAPICRRAEYLEAEQTGMLRLKTGLKLDPYFSATKIRWILENVPEAASQAKAGELLFGNIDSYLIYRLTGLTNHMTDYSNASRTMLFDISSLKFDDGLLRLFDIPASMLPTPMPSCSNFGSINLTWLLSDVSLKDEFSEEELRALSCLNEVAICGVAGDQAAALFGQGAINPGDTKTTYGTGCFSLMNIGERPVFSESGLLTSAAWSIGGKTVYALEGSVFQGGSIITWLRDEMHLISKPSDCDFICESLPDSGGVFLVPAFTGLGAPYWNPDARGAITGLTSGTGASNIVRASVEAIAYQVADLIELMSSATGSSSSKMKVDGGVCASDFLMQFQSDILEKTVVRASSDEMTALGVAYLSGIITGFFSSEKISEQFYTPSKTYTPSMSRDKANSLLASYRNATVAVSSLKN